MQQTQSPGLHPGFHTAPAIRFAERPPCARLRETHGHCDHPEVDGARAGNHNSHWWGSLPNLSLLLALQEPTERGAAQCASRVRPPESGHTAGCLLGTAVAPDPPCPAEAPCPACPSVGACGHLPPFPPHTSLFPHLLSPSPVALAESSPAPSPVNSVQSGQHPDFSETKALKQGVRGPQTQQNGTGLWVCFSRLI